MSASAYGAHLRNLPVSHLIASAKTCEEIMAVSIPHAVIAKGESRSMVQSHALSFFTFRRRTCYWASTPSAGRNFLGVPRPRPAGTRRVAMRKFGHRSSSGSAASGPPG